MADQCTDAEHVASWREYMASNERWQSERAPNVYRAGFIAGRAYTAHLSGRSPSGLHGPCSELPNSVAPAVPDTGLLRDAATVVTRRHRDLAIECVTGKVRDVFAFDEVVESVSQAIAAAEARGTNKEGSNG
jgi:hypothetical protein